MGKEKTPYNDKGNKHGIWEVYYQFNSKLYYTCEYINGNVNGVYLEYNPNETLKVKSNYINGVLNGLFEEYDLKGNLYQKGYYYYGFKCGDWFVYNQMGEILIHNDFPMPKDAIKNQPLDNDGLPHGEHKLYIDNILIEVVNYYHGKKDGIRIVYENGDVIKREYYENDELISSYLFTKKVC